MAVVCGAPSSSQRLAPPEKPGDRPVPGRFAAIFAAIEPWWNRTHVAIVQLNGPSFGARRRRRPAGVGSMKSFAGWVLLGTWLSLTMVCASAWTDLVVRDDDEERTAAAAASGSAP